MDENIHEELSDEQAAEELAAEERAFEEEYESEIEADSPNITGTKDEADEGTSLASTDAEDDGTDGQAAEQEDSTAEEPDRFTEFENRIATRVRNIEGHIGGLKSQIQTALDARQETKQAGGDAPTAKDIKAASGSTEKIDQLREEFPEWAEAIDEQIAPLREQIGSQVDTEAIKGNISEMVTTTLTDGMKRLREVIKVDTAHPGWEDTINSDEFNSWKEGQPEDVQALADSNSSRDAIKMLDAYIASKQPDGQDDKKETKKKQRQQRLEDSVTPTRGGRQRIETGTTDEEEFISAFNS